MKNFLLLALILFTVNASAAALKQAISQETVINKFISWDKNLKTLDTFYEQETSFEGTLISKSFGHLLKNGQNLRLETLENGKVIQYALTDKKTIDIFDSKDNLIMQMPWKSWQEMQQNKSLFDFGNYAKILDEHKVFSFTEENNAYILALTPKEGNPYTLTFSLDKKTFFPKEINLLSEGVNSKTVLQETKINQNLKEISK